jgi:hypothetical protein
MRGSGRALTTQMKGKDSTEVEICQNKQDVKTNGGIWMKGAGITRSDLSPRLSQEAKERRSMEKAFNGSSSAHNLCKSANEQLSQTRYLMDVIIEMIGSWFDDARD